MRENSFGEEEKVTCSNLCLLLIRLSGCDVRVGPGLQFLVQFYGTLWWGLGTFCG